MYVDWKTWFIGKILKEIVLNQAKDIVIFRFEDGLSKVVSVDADCCSHSWIEHLEMPDSIAGATILSVDEPALDAWDSHECKESVRDKDYKVIEEGCGHEVLAVYHTRFVTDKGDIILEYRNDSNGYYGGSLTDEGEETKAHRGN